MNETDAPVAQRADAVEAAAWREMYAAAPTALVQGLGLEVREIGGATALLATSVPDGLFNRVIGFGVQAPATEALLEEVIAQYRRAGIERWWVQLTPTASPVALPQWLERRGFRLAERRAWAKMHRGSAPVPAVETEVAVRRARPGEEAALAETVCAAYGMPHSWAPWFEALAHRPRWRAYAALDAGRIVGAGWLYIEGGEAWLGAGAVRQEARGRHAHRALMALRISEAIAAGCRHIVTETGEPVGDEPNPSLLNMQCCGFQRVCARLNYAAPT